MKIDKKLVKTIDKLVKISFDGRGELIEDNVKKSTKSLQILPLSEAIEALNRYMEGIKREIKKGTLEIETATSLSQGQIKEIVEKMRSQYRVLQVKTLLNDSLLGGTRVKIGDVVFDDSVDRKMLQLREVIES
ncbi:MAG: F0F1 ATP synthase subunit delta [Patescibacteria group bacterium]|nr:F0F1 ATP synthase subunit delta [Patescibacteria group bacterium]